LEKSERRAVRVFIALLGLAGPFLKSGFSIPESGIPEDRSDDYRFYRS
jgi:hypothetical protein